MTIFDNPRSRSFIDLCPRSFRCNIFKLSQKHQAIETKFYMEPPWDVGNENVFKWSRSHDQDGFQVHIWKKKNFKNHLFWNQKSRWPWNVVYRIGYSSASQFVHMMSLGWPWPVMSVKFFLMLLHGWKLIQHIVMYFQACSITTYP